MLEQRELLGIRCHLFTIESLNKLVQEKIAVRTRTIIANHNLHSIYLFHKNESFRAFFNLANYIHIDGMPIVYWGKIIGHKMSRENRITYLDWIYPLLNLADQNRYRIFYLGGKPGVAKSAISFLQCDYKHTVFGERNGYFDMSSSEENGAVLDEIKRFNPDILMVGMSMPRQEVWIKDNLDLLPNCVILPCGACFDYLGGKVKTPPRFLGAIGLEWLYRFLQEPERLFFRYFIEPLFLLPFLLKDLIRRPFKISSKAS